jgi:hypothetical protein
LDRYGNGKKEGDQKDRGQFGLSGVSHCTTPDREKATLLHKWHVAVFFSWLFHVKKFPFVIISLHEQPYASL